MNYSEILEKVNKISKKLLATDKRFNKAIRVICNDGSSFLFKNAFLLNYKDWYVVISEHYGDHIYDVDDVILIEQYTIDLIKRNK